MSARDNPFMALWQAVALNAIYESSFPNPHRLEARMFVESTTFALICEMVGWNEAEIRQKMDQPGLFERFRKLRRTGVYGR